MNLPEGLPAWVYALMICLTAAVPMVGALAVVMKRRSEAELEQVRADIDKQKAQSAKEMEQVRADTSQALAASKSIEALTNTLVTMVEERRESTAATKENTAELKHFSAAIGDWDDRQRLFFQTFSANIASFNLDVASSIKQLHTTTAESIALMLSSIDNMIPRMVENVTPLVGKLDSLLGEVQRSSAVATEGRDGAVSILTNEIRTVGANLLGEVKRLEAMIERAINFYEGETYETPDVVLPDGDLPLRDGSPASAGTGNAQPQLIGI